ncbi:MAG TPA: hypothetical protein VJ821_08275 [Anaerolineales bacterium]|nr:hypothetical protein [Anaerolineales bacterium]
MTVTEANQNSKRIWLGLGAAALFCLCAVAVAALVFMRIGQQFRKGMKTDPQGASEAAHAIADYELPEGYQERIAMDFFAYSMVVIGPDTSNTPSSAGKPMIMLAQFQVATDQQQMREQMRRSFEQQSGRRGLKMEVVDVKQMTIRGEKVDVTTFEGTDENGFVMRQVIATFPGKDGTAILMIMGAAQTWDKEEIDQFIESIH